MTTVQIDAEYRIPLPEDLRGFFQIGDKVTMAQDAEGRIVIMSAQQILDSLQATFGMWADRDDIPGDGIAYMDDIRQGSRLDEVD